MTQYTNFFKNAHQIETEIEIEMIAIEIEIEIEIYLLFLLISSRSINKKPILVPLRRKVDDGNHSSPSHCNLFCTI